MTNICSILILLGNQIKERLILKLQSTIPPKEQETLGLNISNRSNLLKLESYNFLLHRCNKCI